MCACGRWMGTRALTTHRQSCEVYRNIRTLVTGRRPHKPHEMAGRKGTRRAEYLRETGRDTLERREA
jgi:hypothetical protein